MSLEPSITEEQHSAMANGISFYTNAAGEEKLVDLDYYKEKQRIPNQDGEWADYKTLAQYRLTAFSIDGKKDIDTREAEYQAYANSESFTLDETPSQETSSEEMNETKEKVAGDF